VASDADLVERLYYRLRAESVDVWWDKLCLPPGQPWEQGFADGLCSSDIFVSVLSKTALAPFAQLTAASACDNMLLEQQLALELYTRGDLRAIYPVLVGELKHHSDEFGDLYSDFFKSGGVPACPDEVVKAVEDKVAEHLERLGKGALSTERTVKATLDAITQFQGVNLSGTRAEATDKVVAEIVKFYRYSMQEAPASETVADEPSEVQDPVWCDGCGLSPIRGPRWKCNQCADFDLCDICHGQFRTSGHYHPGEHTFRRMRNGKHPLVKCDNGAAYEGEWLNSTIHGRGIFTWADGRR
jgi:hypothetical protein